MTDEQFEKIINKADELYRLHIFGSEDSDQIYNRLMAKAAFNLGFHWGIIEGYEKGRDKAGSNKKQMDDDLGVLQMFIKQQRKFADEGGMLLSDPPKPSWQMERHTKLADALQRIHSQLLAPQSTKGPNG